MDHQHPHSKTLDRGVPTWEIAIYAGMMAALLVLIIAAGSLILRYQEQRSQSRTLTH